MNLRNLTGIVYLPFPRVMGAGRDRLPQTAGVVLHGQVMQINRLNED
ncbi:hypothetical protein HHL25_08025 [Rhizobium sp. S-51]|uniref:Uncharacterized protein n=1 Tax=Rhizobium terricola TaxID=2728849 RepID=A0A7Y0AV39_9HYPH|nr:hypothetical protein [Rhizobium terricola]NML74066.1 hypothetical protein [Rhizobium terricola]